LIAAIRQAATAKSLATEALCRARRLFVVPAARVR